MLVHLFYSITACVENVCQQHRYMLSLSVMHVTGKWMSLSCSNAAVAKCEADVEIMLRPIKIVI